MLKDKSLTYVTLFSSAGVGCHGFQMEGYRCIATNEFMMRSTGGRKKAMIVWTLSLLRHPVRASASLTIKRTVRK